MMSFTNVALGALVVFAATSAGSAIILFVRCIGRRLYSAMLAVSAGVMSFSAVEMLWQSHRSSGNLTALSGLLVGALFLLVLDKVIPHIHARFRKSEVVASKKKAVLLAGALTMHNVPEGFSVASAFASSTPLGWLVTASIALQDIPEGLVVSAPLVCYGTSTRRALGFGIFSGLVEAAAALLGYAMLHFVAPVIPFALSFSAGAMLYVVLVELMPDALRHGLERTAAISFLAGFAAAFAITSIFTF